MITNFYLIVNQKGSVKTTKNKPNLNWDEIAIELNLRLPNSLFQKPQLKADLVVADTEVAQKEIDVETFDNIQEAITGVSGLEVKLSFVKQEDE